MKGIDQHNIVQRSTIRCQSFHLKDNRHRFALVDKLKIDNGVTLSTAVTTTRYQHSNHLGSASLELNQKAAIISYEEYHPFGTTSYRSGRTETEVAQKLYKYVGKERDEETGLYYYGARYYAAWLARFVSVDPLQFKYPELTPYQYASNSPLSMIDIDGLEGISFLEVKKNEVTNRTETIRRVIELNIHIATDGKRSNSYSSKEIMKMTSLLTNKFNEGNHKDESGIPVYFRFNVTTFSTKETIPLELSKELYKNKTETRYTRTINSDEGEVKIQYATCADIVMWKESLKGQGNHSLNRITIDVDRDIYPFGFSESHEITHFFLMGYGHLDQTPNDIPNDDHSLGGWMNYGTKHIDTNGNTIKIEGVNFQLSEKASEAIIRGVPRIEDNVIETYVPKLKGVY